MTAVYEFSLVVNIDHETSDRWHATDTGASDGLAIIVGAETLEGLVAKLKETVRNLFHSVMEGCPADMSVEDYARSLGISCEMTSGQETGEVEVSWVSTEGPSLPLGDGESAVAEVDKIVASHLVKA